MTVFHSFCPPPRGLRSVLSLFLALCWSVAILSAAPAVAADSAVEASPASAERVLDLETAQKLSLVGNPTLQAASERIRKARDAVRQTGEAYWPELKPEGTVGLPKDPLSEGAMSIEPAPVEAETILRARLKAQWTLFDGMKRDFDAAAARFGEQQSKAAADEARRLLLTAVAERYHDAQLAQEQWRIAEEHLSATLRQLRRIRARTALGKSEPETAEEILSAAEAGEAQAVLRGAEETLGAAMAILEALTGPLGAIVSQRPAVAPLSPDTELEMRLPDPTVSIESAERFRPDLQEARFALQRLTAATRAERVDFAPDFKVQGTLEGDLKRDPAPAVEELGGSLGLFMEIPIFEGDTRRKRMVKVRSDRRAAENALVALRREVEGEVLEAVAGVKNSQERLRARMAQAQHAMQEHDRVEGELADDFSPAAVRQTIGARRDLTAARRGLAMARATLRQAWVWLDGATGRILMPFEGRNG